jgi:hypothetical protein
MGRDSGEFDGVPAAQVFDVLRFHGVDVATIGTMTYLSKGETHMTLEIVGPIRRRTLHALHRMFDVPMHHFFHPDMMPKGR